MKKYELLKEDTVTTPSGKTLYRIKALVAIGLLASPGDLGGYIENTKNLDMANKLADAIAEHFDVDLGESSNMNDPYENALEWLEPVWALKNKDAFICGHCGRKIEKMTPYCPDCGLRLEWSDK